MHTPFLVDFVLRYTRHSCAPFRATMAFSRVVQADDAQDAVRQASLCVDRELEEILARVNSINVSEVMVEVHRVERASDGATAPWNEEWFPPHVPMPPHILVRQG